MHKIEITTSESIREDTEQYLSEILSEIYPNSTNQNKVLLIHPRFYSPYYFDSISCQIKLYKGNGNGEIVQNVKIHKPYSNKKISLAALQYSRKYCDFGVPILFDTFEELQEITKVVIQWTLNDVYENITTTIYTTIDYGVSFENSTDENCNVYLINSRDQLITVTDEDVEDDKIDRLNEYLDEFDRVAISSSSNKGTADIGASSFICLRPDEDLNEDEFDLASLKTEMSFGMETFIKSFEIKENEQIMFVLQESTEHITPLKKADCFMLVCASPKKSMWRRENRKSKSEKNSDTEG